MKYSKFTHFLTFSYTLMRQRLLDFALECLTRHIELIISLHLILAHISEILKVLCYYLLYSMI